MRDSAAPASPLPRRSHCRERRRASTARDSGVDRSTSVTSACVPACGQHPGAYGRAFPPVARGPEDPQTAAFRSERASSLRVPSVEPSSTTITSSSFMPAAAAAEAPRGRVRSNAALPVAPRCRRERRSRATSPRSRGTRQAVAEQRLEIVADVEPFVHRRRLVPGLGGEASRPSLPGRPTVVGNPPDAQPEPVPACSPRGSGARPVVRIRDDTTSASGAGGLGSDRRSRRSGLGGTRPRANLSLPTRRPGSEALSVGSVTRPSSAASWSTTPWTSSRSGRKRAAPSGWPGGGRRARSRRTPCRPRRPRVARPEPPAARDSAVLQTDASPTPARRDERKQRVEHEPRHSLSRPRVDERG